MGLDNFSPAEELGSQTAIFSQTLVLLSNVFVYVDKVLIPERCFFLK